MNQSIEIKSLAEIPLNVIFETQEKAFKDYPFTWSRAELLKAIHRRGYSAALSFGAFYNQELVSFTLNGLGYFNNIKTAYDTGTGTVEEFRSKGIATKIFEFSIPFFKAQGVKQYVLEVLQENEKAISVYSKLGFIVSRNFECFRVNTEDWKLETSFNNEVDFREIDFSYQSQMEEMNDFNLSWQNNFQSLLKCPGDFKLIGAFDQNTLIGYGIIEPSTGDIPQLAVNKNYRRNGIGSMILSELKRLNKGQTAKIVNIESNQEGIISFITKNGIPKIVSQFEMIKTI